MLSLLVCSALLAAGAESPGPDVHRAYEEVRSQAGRSPDDQVRLALWCESHGLTAERLNHLALAVLADPKHATARGLMGLVAHDGRFLRPEAVAGKAKSDPTLAEYEARRQETPYAADGQWSLASWCDEHGLKDQARAHYTAVTRLDPAREAAWRRLGYRKHQGRWATDVQLAAARVEAEAQRAADRRWKPALEEFKAELARPDAARREVAERALGGVTDPRAVSSVLQVFGTAREGDQARAVRLLGQVDAPSASRALAGFALTGKSAEVRRAAAESLRKRDPREYAGVLIGLLRKPIKYEVRAVGGPGQPGTLFVEGERYNVRRRYSPPPPPADTGWGAGPGAIPGSDAGDVYATDGNGLPVVLRTYVPSAGTLSGGYIGPDGSYALFGSLANRVVRSDPTPAIFRQIARDPAHAAQYVASLHGQGGGNPGFQLASGLWQETLGPGVASGDPTRSNAIFLGQAVIETQKAALAAGRQLEEDAASIDRYNAGVDAVNRRAGDLLNDATGKSLPPDRDRWQRWLVDQLGYALLNNANTAKPTIVEEVALNAELPPVAGFHRPGGYLRVSCFAAGTTVQTLAGPRPIESIKVGDRVLTQSTATGALGYRPVLVIHRNPPSETYRVKLQGEAIVSSHFHRFWVAGRGWVMARDLKPGDPIRTLGGVSPVEAVDPDKVQLVFNLDVAEDADFFAGSAAALVHDNTLPDPRLAPFDAAPAAVASARRGE